MKKELSTPQAKAERLKLLRKLARFTREEAAQVAAVSYSTYKGWENARHTGLPENRAETLVKVFQSEGIQCSAEWLMSGKSKAPKKIKSTIDFSLSLDQPIKQTCHHALKEDQQIANELKFFLDGHANSINFVVPDNSMLPVYQKNDIVAGIKITGNNLSHIINQYCIVQTQDGDLLLRQVKEGSDKKHYHLHNRNRKSILTDVQLVSAAPVLWHRKRSK